MKKSLSLMLAAVATLSLSACWHTNSDLPPGEYHSTTKSTNSAGTDYKKDTTTNVEVDKYGNKKVSTETKTTTDPEGLMNKSTTTKKQTTYN